MNKIQGTYSEIYSEFHDKMHELVSDDNLVVYIKTQWPMIP